MSIETEILLRLPAWVPDAVDPARAHRSDEDKVSLAVELARRNVDEDTGGPFGAALFGPDDRVLAAGVNCVVADRASVAHAEMMAYMLGEQHVHRWRLNDGGGPITLATSAQPCCQCYGATIWAGVDRLVIGARAADVMSLTDFDEGPLPADWVGELERRGIAVQRDVQREAACAVLRDYAERGGPTY